LGVLVGRTSVGASSSGSQSRRESRSPLAWVLVRLGDERGEVLRQIV